MGFKRKRDGGHRDFRPRLSPTELLIARVRPAIAQIGEPSRYAREGLMRSLVHDLSEVPEPHFPEVLETIRATVFEQPHKIGYLAFVVSAAPSNVSFMVLEMAHDETSKALASGDLARFKTFFRFLCALHPVIKNTEVLTDFIKSLLTVEVTDDDALQRVKTELFKAALLASIYLPAELVTEEIQNLFVETQLRVDKTDAYDFFTGDSKPYEIRSVGSLLMDAAKQLKSVKWNSGFLAANPLNPVPEGLPPKPGQNSEENDDYEPKEHVEESTEQAEQVAEPSAEPSEPAEVPAEVPTKVPDEAGEQPAEASVPSEIKEEEEQPKEEPQETKHNLRSLHLLELQTFQNGPFTPLFYRCYLPIDGTVATVPAENTIGGILLRDVAVDNMRNMDFNRREVTRQLIALDVFFSRRAFAPPGAYLDQIVAGANEVPPKPTWKVEDIALEAIFSQMLDLENTCDYPHVYYHSLFIEACVMAPQDIAPVLGRGIRFLFTHLESADVEVFFRSLDWFSHHVSNFAFTWKWSEWLDALKLPADHPQQVFIRELLAKEVRLSYPQRVRDVLPEEFQGLVPTAPDVPPFKYADDSRAEELIQSLRANDTEKVRSDLDAIEDSKERINLLTHLVCHLGNRSVTHATTWISKTEELFKVYAPIGDEELSLQVVQAIFEHWADAPWVGALVVNQFIKVQLIKPATLVRCIVEQQNLLLSALGWEVLSEYPAEATKSLESVKLEGEYSEWWKTRIQKALARKASYAELQAEKQQRRELEAEKEAQMDVSEEQQKPAKTEESDSVTTPAAEPVVEAQEQQDDEAQTDAAEESQPKRQKTE